jgi:pyruvate,water dikinase
MEGEKEVIKEFTKEETFDDKYIKWFSEISNKDIAIVGGKGASLGEMFNNKFPVPPGFVITAQAFGMFMERAGLKEKIADIIERIDFEETEELQSASKEIRSLMEEQEIPDELRKEILEAYHILSSDKIDEKGVSEDALSILKNAQEPIFVSVRSSATTEDLVDASFAGQQESFLNIKGDSKIIDYIRRCFSSLYTARAIYYRNKKGFKEGQSLLAVVIQKMVDSEKSGVIFSRDPLTLNENVVLEAVYGLGEGIVSGKIKPDHYSASRELKVESVKVADKKIAIVRTGSGTNEIVKLSDERSKTQVLTNGEILELTDLAIKLENHYKKPQDIEFAIEAKEVYIVQSRPITTKIPATKRKEGSISGNVILEGLGASPGIGVGVVKIIHSMEDLPKIKKGDVLVTTMTNPDMVVSMQKSAAIVTDEGGMTAHASIVSREMGIPAIVGTGDATTVLKEGMKITVDGSEGKVYEGAVAETQVAEIKKAVDVSKVKLKLIVDLPEFAERAAESGVDAVGLTRIEGIIASSNKHPLLYQKQGNLEDYTELLRAGLEKISLPFKMLWLRSSDIRTDEYSSLDGAPEREINPMLGLHGIRFSLKHPEIFKAELEAVKQVAEKYPDKKFGIMFPQVISIKEIKETKQIWDKFKVDNMQFGVMIETPASVQIIDEICEEGVDFVSFGTNDLTQYTLAVDRGEDEVQYLYDELDPAIFSQIKKVIESCKRHNVEVSICGQAGSKPKMAEFLFKQGIDSISVNADAAFDISTLIKRLEDEGVAQEEVKEEVKEKPEQRQEYVDKGEQREERKSKNPRIVTCSDCGKETRLPFLPRKNKDYFCKQCYFAKKDKNKKEQPKLLPKLPKTEKEKERIDVEDIKEYKEELKEDAEESASLLDKGHIQTHAELKELKIEEEPENLSPIEPIDNLDAVEDRAEDILRQVEESNEEELEEDQEIEDNIETSGEDVNEDEDIDEENERKVEVILPDDKDNDNKDEYHKNEYPGFGDEY